MKIKTLIYSLLFATMMVNISCNEEEFLKEVPLDFYSPENSYVTYDHYQAALADLYARVRFQYSVEQNARTEAQLTGTDIGYNAREDANNRVGDYNVGITPQGSLPKNEWVNWYKVISNANTIISRLPNSDLSADEMKEVQAEAKLFRAW